MLSLFAVSLESIDSLSRQDGPLFILFEIFSVIIFWIKYLLRIRTVADNEAGRFKTATSRRLDYICSFTGLIDLIAILPSNLPLFLGQVDLRWLRVLGLVRLLKISHYSLALEDLLLVISAEKTLLAKRSICSVSSCLDRAR